MRTKKDDDALLCFSFCTDATLKSSLAEVKKYVDLLPGAKLSSVESGLKYFIDTVGNGNNGNHNYASLELKNDRIIFSVYSSKATHAEKRRGLLRFISILAYLKEFYDVKMNSFYSEITEAIFAAVVMNKTPESNLADIENQRISALSDSNLVLSIEIRKLDAIKRELEEQNDAYMSFCSELLEKFPKSESGQGVDGLIRALGNLGISNDVIGSVVKLVGEGK